MNDIVIQDNPAEHRYEVLVAGKLAAHSDYNVLKDGLLFTHTEVLPEYEGQGLGSQLARYALDDVRSRKLLAVPVCQFIAGYIRRHPKYHDLVTEANRRAYKI